ncbi:MAG: murein hydrolase activator EnvC family protein [Parvularculaceae bacterium]
MRTNLPRRVDLVGPSLPPRLTSLALGLFAALAAAATARAQTDRGDLEELKRLEREIEAREREEARLKDEARARAKEVRALRARMIETANALQDAERRIDDIAAELLALNARKTTAEASLREQQTHLGDVLAALQSLERARPPALLVSPDDAAEAARAAMLLAEAAPALDAKAEKLRATLAELAEVRARLDDERANYERTNEEIFDRRTVLAELLRTKQRERDVALELAKAAQSETAALAARATNLREVLARLERLAQSITPRLKPPPAAPGADSTPAPSLARVRRVAPFRPSTPFASARGKLRAPIVGDVVGRFGDAREDLGPLEGLRYRASPNAIVTAPYEASVVFARFYEPTGNLIVLDVGDGYHILLIGVDAFLVDEGQNVAAGEPIALMPPRAAQLGLEIRRRREPVNPATWIAGGADG